MRSVINFYCANTECKDYDKEVSITEIDILLDDRNCRSCYQKGKIRITHGAESFNSAGGLVQYFKGLNTEHKLLSKLIKANVADPNDTERMVKIDEILKDAICPCCGNPAKQTID